MNSSFTLPERPVIDSWESSRNLVLEAFLFWIRTRKVNFSLVIGASLGLIGGAIFHSISPMVLAGLPLDVPPFGILGNTLLFSVLGAFVGWMSSSTRKVLTGALLGALAFYFSSQLWLFLSRYLPYASMIDVPRYVGSYGINGLYSTLYVIPFSIPLRILIDRLYAVLIDKQRYRVKPKYVIALLTACALIGYLGLLPKFDREYLSQVNDLVQRSLSVPDPDGYPLPLRGEQVVESFERYATDQYTLRIESAIAWGSILLDYTDPIMQEVVVKFDNGWQLFCDIDYSGKIPYCIGSDQFYWSQSTTY